MTQTNTRTLFIVLTSFVALMLVLQISGKSGVLAPVSAGLKTSSAAKAPPPEPMLARRTSSVVALPLNTCAVSWVNGGNYVLATPSKCNGASVQAMTIRASDKPCAQAREADFRSVTNSTYFKGDFGFFLGQNATPGCLVVEQLLGRYL
jgi:hypothetical protein